MPPSFVVLAFSGTVSVGSADGAVYSFNPVTGQQNWRVVLNTVNVEPVEATLAIGQDGTLYAATRINPAASIGGNVYAINPVTQAKLWTFYGQVSGLGLGFVASPVIDQSGFIYVPVFGRALYKLHPADGGLVLDWSLYGKLCQTPSINQNGLLIIGISKFQTDELNAIAAIRIGDPTSDLPYFALVGHPTAPALTGVCPNSFAVGADGSIHALLGVCGTALYYTRSTDGGATWGPAVEVTSARSPTVGEPRGAKIIRDGTGTPVIVWFSETGGSTEIYSSRLLN